jgi:cytochrome c biogenesis protein CcdA/thiol-disulfide isomerase/thioredoxin
MGVLLAFAFIAGFVTVASPCILPLLPAILAAGGGKGSWRPFGVILGFSLSFIFFTLALTSLVISTGISPEYLRYAAIIIIALFGLVLIFPRLSDWFAEKTSSLAQVGADIQSSEIGRGKGFFSGFILGMALGLVWTPCAGPILAAVTTLVATHAINIETILITITYTLGSAIPMFLIAYGGNRAIASSRWLSTYSETIRKIFGVLMILTAIAIYFNLHILFEQKVLQFFPSIQLEDNDYVRNALKDLRNEGTNANTNSFTPVRDTTPDKTGLPKIAGTAQITGITEWLNSDPLTMEQLRGKVVLVDFWTYSCINCIRTLPYLTNWYDTYKDKGFVIVGVHTPEFEFEKNPANVKQAIERFKIHYPVAMDNNYSTWDNFQNQYWPAHYLIDQNGIVRQVHFGEGKYLETENDIRALLGLAPLTGKEKETLPTVHITPETYLGYERAEKYDSDIQISPDVVKDYQYKGPLPADHIGLKGKWTIQDQYIVSDSPDSSLDLNFQANRVYLVIGGKSDQPIKVLLDDKPVPEENRTDDMDNTGAIKVQEDRKYDIVDLKGKIGRHKVTLIVPTGIRLYAFTFGMEKSSM